MLVRNVLGRPEAAAVELRHVLPSSMVAALDLGSLELQSASYPRPSVGALDSDLLYAVALRDPRAERVYVSIDHQSTADPLYPLRAHVYAGAVWRRYVDGQGERPRALPFIIPVLLRQRPARRTPTRLSDVLVVPARARPVLGAPFEAQVFVDDLEGSVLDDSEADRGVVALVEITRALLDAHRNPSPDTRLRLQTLGPCFDAVLERYGPGEIEELLSYVIHVFGQASPVYAIILATLGRTVNEVFVSIADKLRAEGRKEGRAEGRKEGRRAAKAELLLRVLVRRMGRVPRAVRARISATTSEPLLQQWLERALTATTLEEVFGPSDG